MSTASKRIEQWVREDIRALHAYHVHSAQGLIKLDAMENPYGLADELRDAWTNALRDAPLNRYPDPGAALVKDRLREVVQIPADCDILLGNGSDELIQVILLALAQAGRAVVAPEPTFVMYRMIAGFAGMRFVGVPLRADFSLDVTAMLEAIEREEPAVVFLAYPNNPTGNLFADADIEHIVAAAPGLVVIDEAYAPFAEASFLARVLQYDNVVVMRTLSKMGLAGLRLGYLAGDPAWLHEFDKVRLPYNINVLTQISTDFLLRHHEVFERQSAELRRAREELFLELNAIAGLQVFASRANFILFRAPPGQGVRMFEHLRHHGVLIKNLHPQGGMLVDCLRVTVGTEQENRAFLHALGQFAA
ncbi:MAG: histidinol-phosphate transaminase [Gammaproteobacteria bacterium]|nr:histidinol-phosphate transaminase [Gammaproteobacteria bacterium]